jgi:ArsR family transcriptional regulator
MSNLLRGSILGTHIYLPTLVRLDRETDILYNIHVSEYNNIKVKAMLNESKVQLFKQQASICKTLADPKRLMILHELQDGEKSVNQLVSALDLPQANVSQHLAILRERSIVTTRREGTTIYYKPANPKIGQACDLVREVLADQLSRNQALVKSLVRSSRRKRVK